MAGHKIGSYITHYRSRRKEAAEEEKRKRLEDTKRRPEIIDPSYEILGLKSPPTDQSYEDPFSYTSNTTTSPSSMYDDWMFQTRTESTSSRNLQFEPYCEVTPKSSVSSNNTTASDVPPRHEYDMGWDTSSTTRPRPYSYLPSSASALGAYSSSMTDLNRGSAYQSKTTHVQSTKHQRQESLPSYSASKPPQTKYRLESSLSRPFSIDDPLDALTEPVRDSHLYHRTIYDEPQEDASIQSRHHEHHSEQRYRDDVMRRGYRS